ncbi:MAG: DUF2948 family protein [Alphaproteobacteria bacterium]|nr:DUF2948 family protein [Alphaproteobacteria bacterium]
MSDLKLIALDAEDLNVISAQLQDAVGRIGDIAYDRKGRRLAMVMNRFDWSTAANAASGRTAGNEKASAGEFERRQSGLRFEGVTGVRTKGIDRSKPNDILSLLAISFEQNEAPSGTISLLFADGPQIALDVEYIECELKDLGAVWATRNLPQHPGAAEDES